MFWRSADWPGRHADVWVPKSLLSKFTAALAKSRVSYNVEIDSWNVTDDDVTMEHIDQFDGDYRGVKSVSHLIVSHGSVIHSYHYFSVIE